MNRASIRKGLLAGVVGGLAAMHGAAAEYMPAFTKSLVLPFGATAWLAAHVNTVPALGLSPPVTQSTLSIEGGEFLALLVYGGLTELIPSRLRRFLPA